MELARVYTYRGEFAEAEVLIAELFNQLRQLSEWTRRKLYDFALVFHYRKAEHHQVHHDPMPALSELVKFKRLYLAIPANSRDARTTLKLPKVFYVAQHCLKYLADDDGRRQATELMCWVRSIAGDLGDPPEEDVSVVSLDPTVYFGTVISVKPTFAFVTKTGAPNIFLHRSAMVEDGEWPKMIEGVQVKYKIGTGSDGRPRAAEVEVSGPTPSPGL